MTNIKLKINGTVYEADVESYELLSAVIRDTIRLTGTKQGCSAGVCGSCTVILDGRPTLSCLMFAVQADGKEITTIEGLEKDGELHPLQKAFVKHYAFECGFCAPGMIMNSKALLDRNPRPTPEEVLDHLTGNICRCAAYDGIKKAVLAASRGEV